MTRWIRDVIYSVVILVFCIVCWFLSGSFSQHTIKVWAATPSTYSRFIFIIMGVLALVQLIRALRERPSEKVDPIWSKQGVITMCTLVLYVFLLKKIGFFLSTFLLSGTLTISYSAKMGKIDPSDKKRFIRQVIFYISCALLITLIIKFVFGYVLGAKLPTASLW